MSDDESSYKARDPRLKKMGHSGDFPPPPGTSDLYSSGDGHRKSRGGHSRSRSRSPESRSRRGRDYDHHSSRNKSANSQDDVWKKNTDAFLQNLGASPGIVPQMGVPPPGYHPPYGGYPPQMGYAPYGAAPGYPPQMPGYGMPEMEDPRSRSSQSHQRQELERKKENRSRESLSPDDDRKSSSKKSGITKDQFEKLKAQEKQYLDAKDKLEAQLLKLKEQRESFKEEGAVHDDQIMRENAKLQKEVKSRIQYILDVLAKMETAMKQPIVDERRERSPSPKETRRIRKASSDEDNSDDEKYGKRKSSAKRKRDGSEERRRSRSKSKKTHKDSSSSESEAKVATKNKAKKRKNDDSSDSSSSSESASEKDKKKGNDINPVARLVADLKSSKPSKKASDDQGKKSDEMLMQLLNKMSEAYTEAKKEATELKAKVMKLEAENQDLKKQLEEKSEVKKFANTKITLKDDEVEDLLRKKKKGEKIELKPLDEEEQVHRSRSIRAKMIEEELSKPRVAKRQDSSSSSRSSSVSKSRKDRSRSRSVSKPRKERSRSRSVSRPRKERSRSRSRRDRSRSRSRRGGAGGRSRSRSRRSRSGSVGSKSREMTERERERERRRQELRDREREREKKYTSSSINLDEWRPKSDSKVDPTLAGLKAKIKQKQETEVQKQKNLEEEQEKKLKSWQAKMTPIINQHSDPKANQENSDLNPSRPQVAIQWGSGKARGKTPDSELGGQAKKAPMPFVGKMPSKKKDTPDREKSPPKSTSRFGAAATGVPPPGVVSNPPYAGLSMPIRRAPPKNPTPKNVDIRDMIAAAKAHMIARGEAIPDRPQGQAQAEIPLPPLPAAQDRDPDAMRDTRPPKIPTPPPVREKTELELMLEKHNAPPGFSGEKNVHEVKPPAFDYSNYAQYAAHWGPGYDPRSAAAAAAAAALPVVVPEPANPEDTLAAVEQAVPGIDRTAEAITKAEEDVVDDVDPDELAMLGIDPSDFAGFGQ